MVLHLGQVKHLHLVLLRLLLYLCCLAILQLLCDIFVRPFIFRMKHIDYSHKLVKYISNRKIPSGFFAMRVVWSLAFIFRDKYNVEIYGFLFIIKTKILRCFIEKLAKPKLFWRWIMNLIISIAFIIYGDYA